MNRTQIRIGVEGRIGDHTATSLGGWIEADGDDFVLVAPYVDQCQLTGLLVRLADLHIGFRWFALATPGTPDPDPSSATADPAAAPRPGATP